MELTLGFSPCPNDTFIFDAMVNGKIDTHGISFSYVMEDVETLNIWAEQGRLDITKLSYSTFLHTVHQYALLHSGSALGQGVGPLLVSARPIDLSQVNDLKIAIPGFKTTANLLLSLAFPQAQNKTEFVFNEIEAAVLTGGYDAGLMIHEGRFTYQAKGLVKLLDLGDWWEQTTHAAIPLGGIMMKRTHDRELCATVDSIIKASIAWAWERYPQLAPFVTENAQEMEEEVMRKHIQLYVNNYSTDLGETGRKAITTLFDKARAGGLLKTELPASIFY